MSAHARWAGGGRHELGQNFLIDHRIAARIARLVPPGPVVELGPGDGALTRHLVRRSEQLTAVELDPWRAAELERRFGDRMTVVHGDMLRFRRPEPHHVVSNVPFGITTPLLRHLLGQAGWGTAVLLLQ
jgi:23S rRNA (adenine-N6)-dimethyltransferase